MESLVRLQAALLAHAQTLACAESLTGGSLAAALSSTPGASAVFRGGVVCYATEVKRDLLAVTAARVISAECAEQLASGVQALLKSSWAVSTTGVAGPDQQEEQPVGMVFVAVAGPNPLVRQFTFAGDRDQVRRATVTAAVNLLLEALDD